MSQKAIHTESIQYLYDNPPWLYDYVFAFFYGFVLNDNYGYNAKSPNSANILPLTSYTYDSFRQHSAQAFGNIDYDYDYFCGNMTISGKKEYGSNHSWESHGVAQSHTMTKLETGFDYFGARYYDSDLSVWLSVDPMSDKYPNQSAYSYVGWRPINVIDPNGEDEWEINECGEIVNHIINDKKDAIHIVNKDNVRIEGKSKEFEYGTLQSFSYRPNNNKKEITFFAALGDSKGGEIFQFLAENTNIEWSLTRTGDNVDGLNYIGTSNSEGSVVGNVFVMEYFGTNVREAIHNHPSDNNESSEGDINVASKYEGKFPNINFFNYTKSHGYTQYSSSTKPSLPEFKLAPGQVSANKPREIKALPPTLKMRNLKVDFKHIRN